MTSPPEAARDSAARTTPPRRASIIHSPSPTSMKTKEGAPSRPHTSWDRERKAANGSPVCPSASKKMCCQALASLFQRNF